MGKRELLLIGVFFLAALVVYQVTAPPPAPGERSFSVGQLVNNIRREMQGNRASAEKKWTVTHPVLPTVRELRTELRAANLTVVGEDRQDVVAEVQVRSTGYDTAEAARLAGETTLKFDDAGASVVARIAYPQDGRQTATLVVRVPAGLELRVERHIGPLKISGLKAVEIIESRGNTEIRDVPGRVAANQFGGDLTIRNAGSVKLTTRGSDVTLERVTGAVTLETSGGELKTTNIAGPIELDARSTDITLDKLQETTGTIRATATAGTLTLRGLQTDGRIDARQSEVEVQIDRAAPIAIYSEGDEDVRITAPPGGYDLDAMTREGQITLPDGTLKVTTTGQEQRAKGSVRGGGGAITVRADRGDIVVAEPGKASR